MGLSLTSLPNEERLEGTGKDSWSEEWIHSGDEALWALGDPIRLVIGLTPV